MALPTWPGSLPTRPLQQGTTTDSLYQPPLETEMEDGPSRARRRSVSKYSEVTFRFVLTDAQFLTLKTFVQDTLAGGASWFTMPVWVQGAVEPFASKSVRIRSQNGGLKFDNNQAGYTYVTLPLIVRDY